MVDVFISYSKADRKFAQALFRDLAERGYHVWWDYELYAGEDFHDVILEELNRAKAVIVIWSDAAVQSRWVRGEAEHAAKSSKLIPTYIPGFDTERVPLNFRSLHAEEVIDLVRIVRTLERLGVTPTGASFAHRHQVSSPVAPPPLQRVADKPLASADVWRKPSVDRSAGSRRYVAVAMPLIAVLVGIAGLVIQLVTSRTEPSSATVADARKKLDVPPLPGLSGGTVHTIDASLQATALWRVVKREFPDWYKERVDEASALVRNNKNDAAIGKHMGGRLRELRRQQAAIGLQATPQRLKAVAVANLVQLRAHSTEACHALIVGGEANPAIVALLQQGTKYTAGLQAQLTAMFEAIAEGRKQARVHIRPSRADFQQLQDDLIKIGWTQEDFVRFNELRKAPPEKICQLVHDFFKAQLDVKDPEVQTKLLISALGPVFAD